MILSYPISFKIFNTSERIRLFKTEERKIPDLLDRAAREKGKESVF